METYPLFNMKKNFDYLKFDPRRIDKDVDYKTVLKINIYNRINKDALWPYVAKMVSGDVYIYHDDNPKTLKPLLSRLCKEYTGQSLEANHLKVIIKADNKGLILLKY